jgi:hypothetical protein
VLREWRIMTEQGLQGIPPPELADEARRLAGTVLVRIATAPSGESDVIRDLGLILSMKGGSDVWRVEVGRLVAALVAGGLVEREGSILRATGQGLSAATEFLGVRKGLPKDWTTARDVHLIASALGMTAAAASQLRLLRKADGLRALIVASHWKLRIKGLPTAPRIRSALAGKALERAFGNPVGPGISRKSELPARAARQLAAQLSSSGREFGTDSRLIAALAAEAIGSRRGDLKSLQLTLLRKFLGRALDPPRRRKPPLSRSSRRPNDCGPGPLFANLYPPATAGQAANGPPSAPGAAGFAGNVPAEPLIDAAGRPDPTTFASAVHAATAETAEGWAGNRKAFISKVWALIRSRYARWDLTEIEFKCMLTEAHRTGLVVLVNADLKDKRALKELQESAVVYKNTVWHYVRAAD